MTFAWIEKFLLFVTILLLPTQLGRHFWPQFSFVYSLPIDYLSPAFYFWDVLVILLCLIFLLRANHINKLALNLFFFFILTQSLSILFNIANIGVGLARLEQYFLAGLFGVYLSSCKFSKIKSVVFFALAFSVTGESILAIMQFFKQATLGFWLLGERTFTISTPGIAKFDFYGREFLRPYATFPHPNVLAGFLLLAIVILSSSLKNEGYYYILLRQRRIRMTILKITAFLAGLTIFLTMSRVVILAGFITLVIFLRRKSIIFIIFIIFIISPILFTRYSSLLNFDNLTLIRREELVGNAWQMFLRSPVFGIGLNNFIPAMAGNLVTGPSRFLQPVHNIFLLALSETGLIGLIGWICLIGVPVWSSLPRVVARGKLRQGSINNIVKWIPAFAGMTTAKWFLLPWLIIFFLGMFDHYFLTLPQGYRLLFFVWGLSFSMLK